MYKCSDLIGKSIVTIDKGEALTKARDVVFDSQTKEVLALLVDEGGLLHGARIIPYEQIKAIGPDAITVDNESVIIEAKKHPKIERIIDTHRSAKGLKVMTDTGENLGTITDMYFDETSGTVTGYEVSGGMFADAYTGRSFLPAPKTLKLGEDVAFVPAETAQLMAEQTGGLKGKAQELANNAHDKVRAVSEQTKTKTIEMTRDHRALGDVQTKDALEEVWDKLKNKAAEMKDQTSQQVEDQRVRGALGRTVNRVILDKNDNIILNVGELITNEAINRARQADVLDILLSSVTTQKPKLAPTV